MRFAPTVNAIEFHEKHILSFLKPVLLWEFDKCNTIKTSKLVLRMIKSVFHKEKLDPIDTQLTGYLWKAHLPFGENVALYRNLNLPCRPIDGRFWRQLYELLEVLKLYQSMSITTAWDDQKSPKVCQWGAPHVAFPATDTVLRYPDIIRFAMFVYIQVIRFRFHFSRSLLHLTIRPSHQVKKKKILHFAQFYFSVVSKKKEANEISQLYIF